MLSGLLDQKKLISFGGAILLFCANAIPVAGAQEKAIGDYINEASPYLHHSCESAWAAANENAEDYIGMINKFVAIVFINHDFDVKRIDEAPPADQEQLRVIFYNEIGKRCEADPQKLLAGVVERSLVFAFDEMKQQTK